MATRKETEVILCNACGHPTRHTVMAEDKQEWPVIDNEGWEFATAFRQLKFLICQGCGKGTLAERVETDLDAPDSVEWEYFPPRRLRKFPDWLVDIFNNRTIGEDNPYPSIRKLLEDIYTALDNGSFQLAAMGVRALIEFVMIHQVGDYGTFAKNLEAFYDAGYISETQKLTIATALDVGNAAIHRNHVPSKEDVVFGLSVLETILQMVFVQRPQREKVQKRVPMRDRPKPRKKASTK